MKFGVVIFPGSNCDRDAVHVLKNVFEQEVVELWHKDTDLQGCEFIVLPGGFSYGDYLRSGAIARFSPIMQSVIDFANDGGYVLGICNGFQILCEAHLLPGALLHNNTHRFICKNVHLRVETADSLLTHDAQAGDVLRIPIAHAEGRYHADAETIEQLKTEDRILFRYSDDFGDVFNEADINPNGSVDNIAGITNEGRNVFGMMPHPERAAEAELGNTDGRLIFESILSMAQVS